MTAGLDLYEKPSGPRFDHPEAVMAAVLAGIDDVTPTGTWPGEAALLGLPTGGGPTEAMPARLARKLDRSALVMLLPGGGTFLGLDGTPREDLTVLAQRLRHRLPYLKPADCTGYSPTGRVSWDERLPPRFLLPLPLVYAAWRAQWAGDRSGATPSVGYPVPPVEKLAQAIHPGLDPEVLAYEVWLFSAAILANARTAGLLAAADEP